METKQIRRWKGGMDAIKTAQCLHDMAAEGWILVEAGYLFYIFQEAAPADLKYSLKTFKEPPSKEELEIYTAAGWQVVDHWEQEYVFVKERQNGEEEIDPQEIQEAFDQKMQKEKKSIKYSFWLTAGMMLIFAAVGIARFGFSQVGRAYLVRTLGILLLPFFLGLLSAAWRLRRLQKQRRRAEEGEPFYAERDWRLRQKVNLLCLGVGILLVLGVIYYQSGLSEKEFDLPKEISYENVPAVRLERIEGDDLLRVGDSIEQEEEQGFQAQLYGGLPKILERIGYDNYGVDYRPVFPLKKRVDTDQRMRHRETAEEVTLQTEYDWYYLEILAKQEYTTALKWETERLPQMLPNMTPSTILDIPAGTFDELHVCEKYYNEERKIHILCRKDGQYMELDYSGEAEITRILREMEAVFAAQA